MGRGPGITEGETTAFGGSTTGTTGLATGASTFTASGPRRRGRVRAAGAAGLRTAAFLVAVLVAGGLAGEGTRAAVRTLGRGIYFCFAITAI